CNGLRIDRALDDQMRGTEVSRGLILPGNVKLGIGGRGKPIVFYISGSSNDDAPFVLRAEAERFAQRILPVGEEPSRKSFAYDHRLLCRRAIFFPKTSAMQDPG